MLSSRHSMWALRRLRVLAPNFPPFLPMPSLITCQKPQPNSLTSSRGFQPNFCFHSWKYWKPDPWEDQREDVIHDYATCTLNSKKIIHSDHCAQNMLMTLNGTLNGCGPRVQTQRLNHLNAAFWVQMMAPEQDRKDQYQVSVGVRFCLAAGSGYMPGICFPRFGWFWCRPKLEHLIRLLLFFKRKEANLT